MLTGPAAEYVGACSVACSAGNSRGAHSHVLAQPKVFEEYVGERTQLAILNFIKAFTEGNDPKTWRPLVEEG